MILRPVLLPLILLATTPADAAPKQQAGLVRVRLVTSAGPIVLALDTRRAPITSANFLAYVDDGRFEGTEFYRAARRKTEPKFGFIQGGIATDLRRSLAPIRLEPTDRTGIRHLSGTLSMAHSTHPDSGMGNFVITVGAAPGMDARGDYRGYAAFGHVVSGMPVVQKILSLPTGGGKEAMRGQMILRPVKILRAERIDGVAKPTGLVKPWLIALPKKKPELRR
ncbi:peptidylprolyl isomerase [Sphingobium subterraneum]|nr:peptidylprolyl isomerase [Sphingobium subterraneum]